MVTNKLYIFHIWLYSALRLRERDAESSAVLRRRMINFWSIKVDPQLEWECLSVDSCAGILVRVITK